jgi:hypothetical protein
MMIALNALTTFLNGIIELKKEHKQDDELPYLCVVS